MMPDSSPHSESDSDTIAEEKIEKPSLYRVLLINDDFTPMEFVVAILMKVFQKPESEAQQIMWHVHTRGRGLCGVYPYDIAQTKVAQVRTLAKRAEHPLECVMEKEDH